MLSILIAFISLSSIKSRVKIDTKDIEKSKSENISYLNKIGYTFLVLMISNILILVNSFISYVNESNLNLYIAILSFILMIVSIIYLMFTFINSPNMNTSSSFSLMMMKIIGYLGVYIIIQMIHLLWLKKDLE